MDWRLDKKRPICPQICEKICVFIASGEINAGDRLMSVREVASSADVTPNTVQKAYESLEQQGIIYSKRGSGWFVCDSMNLTKELLDHLIHTKTVAYLNEMQNLGLDKKEVIAIIKNLRYA